ncbi:MAG: hypothetical protein J5J00_09150 [Deltaproteobacteria bacterium]|nr:hypothetical protein [Deltaproteobacteria bacterium]
MGDAILSDSEVTDYALEVDLPATDFTAEEIRAANVLAKSGIITFDEVGAEVKVSLLLEGRSRFKQMVTETVALRKNRLPSTDLEWE